MQKEVRLADRMLEIMMAGVSTRRYEEVLPEMAERVGISKSQVSKEFIEAGQRMLQSLAGKDFSELDILVVYIDGIQFGKHHVICAMGVDSGRQKHVLGLRVGATENAEVSTALLEELAGRGLDAFAGRYQPEPATHRPQLGRPSHQITPVFRCNWCCLATTTQIMAIVLHELAKRWLDEHAVECLSCMYKSGLELSTEATEKHSSVEIQ